MELSLELVPLLKFPSLSFSYNSESYGHETQEFPMHMKFCEHSTLLIL